MDDRIFRLYDIRGKVGSELIIDDVYDLARALAFYFLEHNPRLKTVVVGMDGRHHSAPIKQEVCRALTESGLNVIFIGICPSPVLYFALATLQVDAGIMITASHNPKEYNGLKICLGTESIWGEEIIKIRNLFRHKKHIVTTVRGMLEERDVISSYVTWLSTHFAHLKNMSLSVVMDCGNATAGTVLPQLIEALEWQNVRLLYEEVDGDYPHHEADPTIEENMQDVKKILTTTTFELGIGFDGDADRMAPMTKEGQLVLGDQLLALFAYDIVKQHPGAAVVFDVKASSAVIELLEQWGARPVMSATGYMLVKEAMKNHGALLGGELSCHFSFNDRYFGYDDGIYAALRLCELLVSSGKSLKKLLSMIPARYSSPEYRIECEEEQKMLLIKRVHDFFSKRLDATLITIDGVRVTLPYGWGLIRASNTQPMLSLRFEANSLEDLNKIKREFVMAIHKQIDKNELEQLIGLSS